MIIYSFRTAPFREKLLEMNTKVFIFGRLKEDFVLLTKKILDEKPDFIVGIAEATKKSQFESKTLNQFNQNKKVVQGGETQLNLYIPENPVFPVSLESTDSFCNWAAYKISKLIKDNDLKTKLVFVHLKSEDLDIFLESLENLE